MPKSAPISEAIALRIGLAARSLPEIETPQLIKVIGQAVGLPPSPDKLQSLTVRKLREQDEALFDSSSDEDIKACVGYLRGDLEVAVSAQDLPKPQAYQDGDMPNSIRVAIASNAKESLDGHFGSCSRFLIYQVSGTETRLIALRETACGGDVEDKNAFRADLINDCHVLYVISIGGPAAAKVVRRKIHPIKLPMGGEARSVLGELQDAIRLAPPPWLAKAMGVSSEERVRFAMEED